MDNSNLFEHLNDPRNAGTSVWVFSNARNLTYVTSHAKSLPKLNSNKSYCVISCKHDQSVLQDQSYRCIKFFLWIGARSPHFDTAFEQVSSEMRSFVDESQVRTKLRFYIELQYAESNQFFALFRRFPYTPASMPRTLRQYCCLQYLDYE